MQRSSLLVCGLAALTSFGISACSNAGGPESTAEDGETGANHGAADTTVLAETPIAGGTARFLSLDADTILLEAITDATGRPFQDPAIRGMSYAEMYSYWSGEDAPLALQAMSDRISVPDLPALRADVTTVETDGEFAGQVMEEIPLIEGLEGVGVTTSALVVEKRVLTAAQFLAEFCPGMPFCLTDVGTGPKGISQTQRARFWLGHVNALQGNFVIRLMWQRVGGEWVTLWQRTVFEGQLVHHLGGSSGGLNKRHMNFGVSANVPWMHAALKWQ